VQVVSPRWALLALPILTLANSGCGLLFVPYATVLPREPVRVVRVFDFETKAPLENATVTPLIEPWDNWFEPIGRCGLGDPNAPYGVRPHAKSEGETARQGNDYYVKPPTREPLEIQAAKGGSFRITPALRWSWLQVWIPLSPVLGPWMYHTHECLFVVSAPGHGQVWFNDALAAKRGARSEGRSAPPERIFDGVYVAVDEKETRVYLPRVAEPAATESAGGARPSSAAAR
jgi:hypothetical protein